ncbi:hypothetical protein [Noviluteimonas gilva]|uniref:LPS-assembly lipoprotein LptE n=1 Tax=Noviluteimonas gilva TaxID=2682097 RepID=A0A7C9LFZ8_9GAMM|nr:hypothetical protein [Lysobacter gilvus]MUV13501.1 hypothetical protein [Lysobacter gilvus]
MHKSAVCLLSVLTLTACAPLQQVRVFPQSPQTPAVAAPAAPTPITTTRGEFHIQADKNDTWNAIGQIVVNTPGVRLDGRAQMLDLYSLHYRGVEFLVMTKALVLSDSIRTTTTRVTAATPAGKPIDTDASAELLALLEAQLPAAIIDVQARFRAEGI